MLLSIVVVSIYIPTKSEVFPSLHSLSSINCLLMMNHIRLGLRKIEVFSSL